MWFDDKMWQNATRQKQPTQWPTLYFSITAVKWCRVFTKTLCYLVDLLFKPCQKIIQVDLPLKQTASGLYVLLSSHYFSRWHLWYCVLKVICKVCAGEGNIFSRESMLSTKVWWDRFSWGRRNLGLLNKPKTGNMTWHETLK